MAMAQADIYGFFFRRREKRVQMMTRRDGRIYTWHEGVDVKNAFETLKAFREVEKGERKTDASSKVEM